MYFVHSGNHCKINTCSLTVTHRVINHEYFVINHYRLIYICRPAGYLIRRKYPIITEIMKNIQPYVFHGENGWKKCCYPLMYWMVTWGKCHKRVGRRVHLWMFDIKKIQRFELFIRLQPATEEAYERWPGRMMNGWHWLMARWPPYESSTCTWYSKSEFERMVSHKPIWFPIAWGRPYLLLIIISWCNGVTVRYNIDTDTFI